jgi:hypothetical protein
VIYPVLNYSTYLGGSVDDEGNGIAVDSQGAAYVTGVTASLSDFPLANPIQGTQGVASTYAFITKFDPSGSQLEYSTYLGGNTAYYPDEYNNYIDGTGGSSIAVDSQGSAYVTGWTDSIDFPLQNAFQSVLRGRLDAIVTKLSPTGNALSYSTYLGGDKPPQQFLGRTLGSGIAVDSAGHAYVTGETDCPTFPTLNAFQNALGGNSIPYDGAISFNAFVTKFSTDGTSLNYSTYLGGSACSGCVSGDYATGIAVDQEGIAYITGYTWDANFPTANAIQSSKPSHSLTIAFVTKLSSTGNSLIYSTFLGGSYWEQGLAIAVDGQGDAYVAGWTRSTDFPVLHSLETFNNGTTYNAFATEINASGSGFVFSTLLGGGQATAIAVDGQGASYVTGWTNDQNFTVINPIPGQSFRPLFFGTFVAKLNPNGDGFDYSTYLGGSSARFIAVDSEGAAYIRACSKRGVSCKTAA